MAEFPIHKLNQLIYEKTGATYSSYLQLIKNYPFLCIERYPNIINGFIDYLENTFITTSVNSILNYVEFQLAYNIYYTRLKNEYFTHIFGNQYNVIICYKIKEHTQLERVKAKIISSGLLEPDEILLYEDTFNTLKKMLNI